MARTRNQLVGQIQRPGGKPENVQLVVDQRPNLTKQEAAAGLKWVNPDYNPGEVLRYGSVGDGTTDDSTALQAAIDASQGAPYPMKLEPGVSYAVATQLSSTGNIVIEGNGATLLPASTVAALVVNPGADIATTTLSADAQIHSNSITVTSATGFAAGELLELKSSQRWHYAVSDHAGTHDAATSTTILTDSTASFGATDVLVGYLVSNTTDGSQGVITASTGTTVTVAALANGTDNDFDSGDAYVITEALFKGELHVIKAVSGTTITLDDALSDNYDISAETVTANVLQKATAIIDDLNVVHTTPSLAVGIELRNIVDGAVRNLTVDGAQTQGVNVVNCYNLAIDTPSIGRSNRVSLGYGVQINESAHCRVSNGYFVNCRRGVDMSGSYPSRYCVVESNHCDGSGLQSDSGDNFDDASAFGGHETSEHNIYRDNLITHVQNGIILRGVNETVSGNYFYGDIKNACVLSNKATNVIVKDNIYAANLRPEKTLDVVAADDDEQKAPWFFKVTDPPNDTGFFRVLDNVCDDLKNSFCVFTITTAAQTLKNFTIKGNMVDMQGSTANTTVYLLESNDQDFTLEDSVVLDNVVREQGATTLTIYDTGITVDYADTVDIDNYLLPATALTEETAAGANITKNQVYLQLTVRDGLVSITGFVDFDIANATSIVKLQNLPSKVITEGTGGPNEGPVYSWLFVEGITTGAVGTSGMICSPYGTSGTIPNSMWISYDTAAYNTGWPVASDYRVPVDICYYTERRSI